MPENGTSLISEIFRPVNSPPGPSFVMIYLKASETLAYSEKPITSKRVLTTMSGFDIIDWKVRDVADARKWI